MLFRSWLDRGFVKFLLDLHRVDLIDSQDLSGILRAQIAVSRKGGKLKMANVAGRIRRLLQITKLTPVFEVFDSEEQAVESFSDRGSDEAR